MRVKFVKESKTLRLHIRQDHENESNDERHEVEITDGDANHEENEDDKAGYKSNDEESMNKDKTIEGEPDQQHEDELDVRDGVQDYNCDTCDQVFSSKKRLKKHMIKKHTPIGEYACEIF